MAADLRAGPTRRRAATTLFLLVVCVLLLRDIIVRSHTVTRNLILGAINIYLMMALAFAFAYGLTEHLHPGSFTGLEEFGGGAADVINLLYFSFVTMTTLGYGDISPLTSFGMTTAYIEATFGQLYLAILLARLVSLYIQDPRPAEAMSKT